MKITTENNVKQYILDKIEKVYIGFDDNTEVKLDCIIDYDIDLDRIDLSSIEFTNGIFNVEIENHFVGNKKNKIIYVHMEATGFTFDERYFEKKIKVFYDIPCNMSIRRLRSNACCNDVGNMLIQLEGYVE